ncbi:hypothetical protein ACFL0S_06450 [Thermodesulfobacteriota bacterium]
MDCSGALLIVGQNRQLRVVNICTWYHISDTRFLPADHPEFLMHL